MHVTDDIYTGPTGPNGWSLMATGEGSPTIQYGVGPLGRIVFRNIQPLALGNANIATLQGQTGGVPLVLTAGTGVTSGPAPDGSGGVALKLDVPRCVTLTAGGNLGASTFTLVCFDEYGRKFTQTMAGPNVGTVTTLKAAMWVGSVVSGTTAAATVSVGTSNTFGLPFRMIDAGYILSAKWDGVLAQNAGTLVVADQTDPATALTGDPRGTYLPAGAAANGVRRLLIAMHVDGTQCGPRGLLKNAVGVTPV